MSSASGSTPNLLQFLESVPPPVTLLLVQLAPIISRLRWAAEVINWKAHWTDSWLALAGWWALCLSANTVLRYLLPFALLLPALLPYLPPRRPTTSSQVPMTELSISLALSDLTILQSLLPTLPTLPALPFTVAFRLFAVLYLPYILLTYFVPMRILIGVVGTLALTYLAPWACTTRSILWRSAYVRRFLLRLWAILSGSEYPPEKASFAVQSSSASAPTSPPARFLFTILECQRWWMGLDWTAALLPGERPSWCSVSHEPVPHPSAFNLPPATSVYLAVPNDKRVKRTATWRWEEGEWGVLVNKAGTDAKRIETKPPGVEDEGGTRIVNRAASILKERKASIGSSADMESGKDDRDASVGAGVLPGAEVDRGEQLATDADGWVYGDNKWEGVSAKGGIGKYTRYRRWTRIAVLEETVEEVRPGDLGIIKEQDDNTKTGKQDVPENVNAQHEGHSEGMGGKVESPRQEDDPHGGEGTHDGSSVLRNRLKAVVKRTITVS